MIDKALPPQHQLLQTADGSYTLFSERFQEACHSTSGAKSETLLHYFEGCKIDEKMKQHTPLVILEVGFGLGMGLLLTYERLPKDRPWQFYSLELDKDLLVWFQKKHQHHEFLKNLYWEENILKAKNEFIQLTIIQGDARIALPKFLQSHPIQWHAIYQDAFSPKKNPTLWTKQWFSLLKEHSHPEVILSTYSASTSIRKALFESGWGVQKGEKFGTKRASTRARLDSSTDPEILLQMQRSSVEALCDLQIDSFKLK